MTILWRVDRWWSLSRDWAFYPQDSFLSFGIDFLSRIALLCLDIHGFLTELCSFQLLNKWSHPLLIWLFTFNDFGNVSPVVPFLLLQSHHFFSASLWKLSQMFLLLSGLAVRLLQSKCLRELIIDLFQCIFYAFSCEISFYL